MSTAYIKLNRERKTNSSILEETWTKYCVFQWISSTSDRLEVSGYSRYFITPAQECHHSGPSSCWRMCHHQLFWAYPKLNAFGKNIYSEWVNIFGTDLFQICGIVALPIFYPSQYGSLVANPCSRPWCCCVTHHSSFDCRTPAFYLKIPHLGDPLELNLNLNMSSFTLFKKPIISALCTLQGEKNTTCFSTNNTQET